MSVTDDFLKMLDEEARKTFIPSHYEECMRDDPHCLFAQTLGLLCARA